MYCKYCGCGIDSGAVYCSHCGKAQTISQQRRLNLQVVKSAKVEVSEDICLIITILLSVMTIISFLLTWVTFDAGWLGSEQISFLKLTQYTFEGEIEGWTTILAWSTILIGIIAAIMHIYTVVMAATRSNDFLGKGTSAAVWTLILSILGGFIVLALKHDAEQEWRGMGNLVHPGIGLFCCFIFSLIQIFVSYYLAGKLTAKQLYSDHTVVCADCDTSYIRITAATVCPNCGSHAYKSESSRADKSILCAYCGNRFEQKSTLTRCPQCGRIQPQRANRSPSGALVCSHCKFVNPKGAVICVNCHTPLSGGRKPEEKTEEVFCSMCGKKISATVSVCPYCNEAQ